MSNQSAIRAAYYLRISTEDRNWRISAGKSYPLLSDSASAVPFSRLLRWELLHTNFGSARKEKPKAPAIDTSVQSSIRVFAGTSRALHQVPESVHKTASQSTRRPPLLLRFLQLIGM
jgi:hypothetical protein